jgi:hypothetical protein
MFFRNLQDSLREAVYVIEGITMTLLLLLVTVV